MNIPDNLKQVQEGIAEAAIASGRAPEDISLVVVTKTQSREDIQTAISAGARICGENRVQELAEKADTGAYSGAQLHLIGHLQKNKVRRVVGRVSLIHSVDDLALLTQIDRVCQEVQVVQDVLLQVNIGKDENKFGLEVGQIDELLHAAQSLGHVRVRGLMTIPPLALPLQETRQLFAQMYDVFVDIRAKKYHNTSMELLSMGMSGDFREAILEGANMVRIGSSIFATEK